jgi:hypothetical protein
MHSDPLDKPCRQCKAAAGDPCYTPLGLHWVRAEAAGMTPAQMLAWDRDAPRPPHADPGPVVVELGRRDDLDLALAALCTACDLLEAHHVPAWIVARLRGVARSIARTDARRAS